MVSRRIAQTALASALVFTMCTAAMCEMVSDDSDNKGDGDSGGGSNDGTASANPGGSVDTPNGNGGGNPSSDCSEIVIDEGLLCPLNSSSFVHLDADIVRPQIGSACPDALSGFFKKGLSGLFDIASFSDDIAGWNSDYQFSIKVDNCDDESGYKRWFVGKTGSVVISSIPDAYFVEFRDVRFYEVDRDNEVYLSSSECYSLGQTQPVLVDTKNSWCLY